MITGIFFFFSILSVVTSKELECSYSNIFFFVTGKTYSCKIKNDLNITHPGKAEIDLISGMHITGKADDDVKAIYVDVDRNIEYIPKGLDTFFHNIQVLWIQNNKVKEILQADLKAFPRLLYLKFVATNIEVLENDLFEYNSDLKGIYFERNKIYHIVPNVFDHVLVNLSHLNLLSNKCVDMSATDNLAEVKKIVEFTKEKCQDQHFVSIDEKLKVLEIEKRRLKKEDFATFINKVDELEKEFKESKISNLFSFSTRFIKLKKDIYETAESLTSSTTIQKGCVNCCQLQKIVPKENLKFMHFREGDNNQISNIFKSLEAITKTVNDKLMEMETINRKLNENLTQRIENLEKIIDEKLNKIIGALEKE